jgi:valyl-tRNA synthetase
MSEISKTYSPKETESKWYKYWMENNFFRSVPDEREPYTIVIPPPNVTGVLHMGHMLNNTLQDVLIRRARMLGKNACWVPGTDHASIATEAKVVQMLREKGIKKSDLTRDEFLKYAWEWKEKYGGIILDQLKKLGASCDWERTRFTMDENYYEDVINVFIDLYNKGYIYRGLRMVNWDPVAKTAVSDEEVYFKQLSSKLVYVKYKIVGGDGYLTVATVRPETIMGDVAVAVHPDDERYKHLAGKKVFVPLVNREVPIIFDDAIDKEFGTGCLKVTPAHDIVDYEIGLRHSLPVIDTINEDGTISEVGQVFIGLDRFAARKAAIKKLEEDGLIEKSEDYSHQVGHSERTNAVIEPRLSQQWFLKMKDISKPALDAVMNGDVNLIPDKFKNTYRHWMENVKDWCLSRQLWWGHRIPAWYDENGNYVVAKTKEEALKLFQLQTPNSKPEAIKQDEDVLDTWASSWLWPISVFDGYAKPDGEIKYYYPTNDLITAPEILFFWVARMIIAGYEYKNEKPFKNVYLTGIVRDKLGRKMSKSLGNSPEPLELIEKFGADGVRMGMLLCSPAGNDLPFDESYCEQGRNFSNKIWNAFRLIKGWRVDENSKQSEECKIAIEWFANRFNEQLELINDSYNKYRISEALMITYKLFWDDYCAWYLEMIKPGYTEGVQPVIDKTTYDTTIGFFESLLKTLHPFMPFITEELWHQIKERKEKDCIITAEWSKTKAYDKNMLAAFEQSRNVITSIRSLRQEKNISPKTTLDLNVKATATLTAQPIINKLANITSIIPVNSAPEKSFSLRVDGFELYIPMPGNLDTSAEKERLQKELDYNKGFLESVMKKLGNQNFVSKAKPEVIASEEKKKADAQQKIKAIEEQLTGM